MSLVEFLKARLSFTLAEPAVILQEWTQTSSIKDLPFHLPAFAYMNRAWYFLLRGRKVFKQKI